MFSERFCTPLLINIIFVKVILTFPKMVVENSGNAAWIQVLYNTLIALLFFCAVMHIYNRKKNIIEVAEINGGKPLKIIAGILVTAILIINAVPIIRIFPEAVRTVLLQETNVEIIIVVMALAAALGAYLGIEAIARIHRLFLPIAAIVFLSFLLLLIPKYRAVNVFPIFGNGLSSIFIKGFNSLSLFSDLIVLNLLIPYTKNLDMIKRSGRYGIITAGLAATVTTAAYCLSYSYPSSENFIMPAYQIARLINISSFFSRFEAFFEFV
ncbi:MAG: GerAB/ArcD/ProY family transporter, partial [bacterium]|nr:GerAB/ArcD/ProY family transporter [bacterium]